MDWYFFRKEILSQNIFSNRMPKFAMTNHFKYKYYRKTWSQAVLATFGSPPKEAPLKAYLIVIRFPGKKKRPYDKSNLVGGAKPIVDTLKTFGWILDDNPRHLESNYFQFKLRQHKDTTLLVLGDNQKEYDEYCDKLKNLERIAIENQRRFNVKYPLEPLSFIMKEVQNG